MNGSDPQSNPERAVLELEELKLRIRDLRAHWWQRPVVMAPIATIVAALTGLTWAIATGFFDSARRELLLSKRELEYETRELRDRRDQRSRELEAMNVELAKVRNGLKYEERLLIAKSRDVAVQAAKIATLQEQEQKLRAAVRENDWPVLNEAMISESGTPRFIVHLYGRNLGKNKGQVHLRLMTDCLDPKSTQEESYRRSVPYAVKVVTTIWGEIGIVVEGATSEIQRGRQYGHQALPGWNDCRETMEVDVLRSDSRRSNIVVVSSL